MNLFRRITTTVNHSIDTAVGRIENHDAVVVAGLKQTRKQAAKARVALARVKKDREAMELRITDIGNKAAIWERRAVKLKANDPDKAIDCLSRRNACRSEVEALQKTLAQQQTHERELQSAVADIEARMRTIDSQRSTLRTRQYAAEAGASVDALGCETDSCLDDVFERWETHVLTKEYGRSGPVSSDSLDDALTTTEDRAALQAELDSLSDTMSLDDVDSKNEASDQEEK